MTVEATHLEVTVIATHSEIAVIGTHSEQHLPQKTIIEISSLKIVFNMYYLIAHKQHQVQHIAKTYLLEWVLQERHQARKHLRLQRQVMPLRLCSRRQMTLRLMRKILLNYSNNKQRVYSKMLYTLAFK